MRYLACLWLFAAACLATVPLTAQAETAARFRENVALQRSLGVPVEVLEGKTKPQR